MTADTRRDIVERFSIARFFSVYGKTLVTRAPQHNANSAPLNVYSDDFTALGDRIKAERGYRCDSCRIDLSSHRKFLHAHHKDGQKHDSRPENISILCVACHAEQFNHSHIKGAPDYVEFLRVRQSIWAGARASTVPPSTARSLSPGPQLPFPSSAAPHPANWVTAAHELARSHKLGVQDLRKDGGCLWVALKNPAHPAAVELKKLGFQFSLKRQAFWRKD